MGKVGYECYSVYDDHYGKALLALDFKNQDKAALFYNPSSPLNAEFMKQLKASGLQIMVFNNDLKTPEEKEAFA